MKDGSSLDEIDQAFNWLVLILGTITASMLQFPHLYPVPIWSAQPEISVLKVLLTPMIVLVIFWLSSHLIQRQEAKIVLKCFAWIYAIWNLLIDLVLIIGVYLIPLLGPFAGVAVGTIAMPFSLVPALVYAGPIRNQYQLMFPDSRFLNSKKLQALMCFIIWVIGMLQINILAL